MIIQRSPHPMRSIRKALRLLAAWPLLALGSGCGAVIGGGYDVTPPADVARSALESALSAWQKGGKPGTLEGATPPVQAVDSDWQRGQKLTGFEVLREEPGDADKRFVVRLSLARPEASREVRYVVI